VSDSIFLLCLLLTAVNFILDDKKYDVAMYNTQRVKDI